MIVRILPAQIPAYWEVIKFATVKVDNVAEDNLQPYLLRLLHLLLNGKIQCFVKFDEDKTLTRLMITEIVVNKIEMKKYLLVQCLYSFVGESDLKVWEKDWKFIQQFADSVDCEYISFESSNDRVSEIGKAVGFKENFKSFVLK